MEESKITSYSLFAYIAFFVISRWGNAIAASAPNAPPYYRGSNDIAIETGDQSDTVGLLEVISLK